MRINRADCNFEREPLIQPFGFKGGYLSELWQTIVRLEGEGAEGLGLGTQSVLWSDSQIFSEHPEACSNSLMFLATCHCAESSVGLDWKDPFELQDKILPSALDYAARVTGQRELRKTFVLNAMVAFDNAAWQLYALTRKLKSFDDIVPDAIKPSLASRNTLLANIPLITYGVSPEGIGKMLDEGFFFLKIKLGCDPAGDGDPVKMLEWDKNRVSAIHELAKDIRTPYTDSGRVLYYIDINGRYDSRERLMELLDHTEKIGMLDRIILLEEPFPESSMLDVRNLPVRIVADESAHSDVEALERIRLGYGAIALKPIAKTMSMSLKIAKLAHDEGVPCFCADLTVNPILVDWNKNVAARLAPLPGMKIGVLESNGHQNYRNWEHMKKYHPSTGEGWIEPRKGVFHLGEDFYSKSGGIFHKSEHYGSFFHKK